MSQLNMAGSTPAALPVESGGASASAQLQWVQKQLDAHSDKLAGFERTLGEAVGSIKDLAKEEADRATKLAVTENNVSHIRDGITQLESNQITETTLRALHTEMLDKQHQQHVEMLDRMNAIQKELVAQVGAAKDKAAEDLRKHEERARSGRRWVIGLLVTVMLGVAGLTVSAVLTYLRMKGG